MWLLVSVLLLAPVCFASDAQNSATYSACIEKATTQTAMHVCANQEAQRSDAELNKVYQRLLLAVGNQALAVEKIRLAESAWIAYRDAYIEAMYPAKDKQAAYGSSFATEVDLLRAKLTLRQVRALNDLLKQYDDSKQ